MGLLYSGAEQPLSGGEQPTSIKEQTVPKVLYPPSGDEQPPPAQWLLLVGEPAAQ